MSILLIGVAFITLAGVLLTLPLFIYEVFFAAD